MLSVQMKFVPFWKEKEEKIVHTACHNDSSSMSLMFLTPHRKMIGHSQKTCVLWINCSQIILRRKLFYFCFAVLPVSYWQLDRAWNKKQFLWIIAVNLSRSLIKLVPKNVKIRKLAAHGSVGWKLLRSVEVLKTRNFDKKLFKEEKTKFEICWG